MPKFNQSSYVFVPLNISIYSFAQELSIVYHVAIGTILHVTHYQHISMMVTHKQYKQHNSSMLKVPRPFTTRKNFIDKRPNVLKDFENIKIPKIPLCYGNILCLKNKQPLNIPK